MKERPILFSGAMVRAVIAGKKTQTRRLVKPPHDYLLAGGAKLEQLASVPFEVGLRLWVKETWGLHRRTDVTDWYRGSQREVAREEWELAYRADWEVEDGTAYWRPSIHMRRDDSRLTLEVTSIRVERLQEISEEDARAEGLPIARTEPEVRYASSPDNPGEWRDPREAFRCWWTYINGERASWDSNPWVWVVSFRRLP